MKTSKTALIVALSGVAGSKFDASNLLHVGLSTEEIATERTLIPEGEQRFTIGKPRLESGDKDGKVWVKVMLPLSLAEPAVLAELNVKELRSSYTFFVDLTEDGQLATGPNQNIRLGQAYLAAGLEGDDVSMSQLEGRTILGNVKHSMSQKSSALYDEVVALAPIE